MAYIRKHPKSKFWFARFKDRHGKWRDRSTKTTDARQARKIAEQWEDAATRKATALQFRRVMNDVARDLLGDSVPAMTVREYGDAWLTEREQEVAPRTMEAYRATIKRFLNHLGDDAGLQMIELGQEHLLRFRAALTREVSPNTANGIMKHLRMFFRAAKDDGLILDNPLDGIRQLKKERGPEERRPFTLDEIRAILAVADSEWRSLILCGLYSGQRLGDIVSLTWANLDLQNRVVRIGGTRKTGKTMIIPMAGPLYEHFLSLEAPDDPHAPLHPRSFAILERQGRVGSLSIQFGKILQDAGIRPKVKKRATHGQGRGKGGVKELSFHCLRHTAVSMLKEAGVPDAVVMQLVGHDSRAMSAHYTTVGQQALADAAAKLPEL